MLSQLTSIFANQSQLVLLLLRLPIVAIALSFHEMSHAYVAHKMGDDTARNLGRLTMNPLKHLDLIGSISLVLFGIGWAKPVPVNARNFDNPKKGMALTALAGPASNLIMSIVALIPLAFAFYLFDFSVTVLQIIYLFLYLFHYLNLIYAVFNLIPVPPLDGSRIALIFLPEKVYFGIMKYERIIMLIFFAILFFVGFNFISLICSYISSGMIYLISLIPGLSDFSKAPSLFNFIIYSYNS